MMAVIQDCESHGGVLFIYHQAESFVVLVGQFGSQTVWWGRSMVFQPTQVLSNFNTILIVVPWHIHCPER
jgi:hypothetical protein